MGATPFPSKLVKHLADLHGSQTFIETGTYIGTTTRWAAANFLMVYTIEALDTMFRDSSSALAAYSNITCYQGDSSVILPTLIVPGRREVLWLDAHYCCEGTPGERDECPLLAELACVLPEHIVLIDDARLFLCIPPAPHDASQWPSIRQIVTALPKDMFVQVIGDVIWAIPESLREAMTVYLYQDRSPW